MPHLEPEVPEQISTGTPGLDYILRGGLPRGRAYLLQGGPGSGKTTLALQFLLEGAGQGEKTCFIALAQHEDDLRQHARSHGWSLGEVRIEHVAREQLVGGGRQSVISPADVELGELTGRVAAVLEEEAPDRLVFDSIGVLRALSGGVTSRYHEEVALLLGQVREAGTTALLIDDLPRTESEEAFRTLVHGAIELSRDMSSFGADQRSLHVSKLRGLDILTGWHSFVIRTGRLEVFPRLQRPEDESGSDDMLASGSGGLDELLGGGLHAGTACLVIGQAGTGKTTLASTYVHAALQRGERAAVFLFDERPHTYLTRSANLGMDVRPHVEDGQLQLRTMETGALSPGEFAQEVRSVTEAGAKVAVIDSLTGYFYTMQEERRLIMQMHEMLAYMSRRGVLSFLLVAQHGLLGTELKSPLDISYIADTVLLLRNFEASGAVRRAISVVKKRHGDHEKRIREMQIGEGGIQVGDPLEAFTGVFSGNPQYTGGGEALMGGSEKSAEG